MKQNLQKAMDEIKILNMWASTVDPRDFSESGVIRLFRKTLKNLTINNTLEFDLECLINDITYYGSKDYYYIHIELLQHIFNIIDLLDLSIDLSSYFEDYEIAYIKGY